MLSGENRFMKMIRKFVFATTVVLLTAGTLHATPFGTDPAPHKGRPVGKPSSSIAVDNIASYLGL